MARKAIDNIFIIQRITIRNSERINNAIDAFIQHNGFTRDRNLILDNQGTAITFKHFVNTSREWEYITIGCEMPRGHETRGTEGGIYIWDANYEIVIRKPENGEIEETLTNDDREVLEAAILGEPEIAVQVATSPRQDRAAVLRSLVRKHLLKIAEDLGLQGVSRETKENLVLLILDAEF